MIPPTTDEEARAQVRKAVAVLLEHFDAVQILVSGTHPKGGTSFVYEGGGNWFARQGMAHDFIQKDQADTNAAQIAGKITPPSDSGDEWKNQDQ